MIVLAIDPGTTESGFVVYDGNKVTVKGKVENGVLMDMMDNMFFDTVEIEMVASYGMAVGKSVFETCVWIGRFIQQCDQLGVSWDQVYRKDVKMHHCHSFRAKDSNIRQALIDKYGKVGTKKSPNPVYDDSTIKMSGDIWSAFAIATMYFEKNGE